MTNCVNCGSVLHGNKCEYCGTVYSGRNVNANFDKDDMMGTICIGGVEFCVYIANMKIEMCDESLQMGRLEDERYISYRPKK